MKPGPLFDVVIYEISTRTINRIVGRSLPLSGGFHTVHKRVATVEDRINEHYAVTAVPANRFNEGQILPPADDPLWDEQRLYNL
jgi:hypothetical protein